MLWQWRLPTNIFFGADAVKSNYQAMRKLGQKALLVIGQGGSARRNGALNDVCQALQKSSLEWDLFDQVEANPSINTVRKGAQIASMGNCDFVIGIGGGSPLDAAKAIAVLAVNDISDAKLFSQEYTSALPVVAVPTTAGTGSEVTPASIITYPQAETKLTVSSPLIIPRLAFLDPAYTMELPRTITIDTAVDAFAHALEGYLAQRSNPLTDMAAGAALAQLGPKLAQLADGQTLSRADREVLLYASLLAGVVISHTGTSIPHAMGYSLTYFKGLPHGRATGMLLPAFMDFNLSHSNDPKLKEALNRSGFYSIDKLRSVLHRLLGQAPACSREEKEKYVNICMSQKARSIANNLVAANANDLLNMMNSI
ncbi:MAG: iron-containing alcohol dehydrogenase family protein [Syntrophomonadaceae bacterium]|jgi:alcohol dehydrogenase class IV